MLRVTKQDFPLEKFPSIGRLGTGGGSLSEESFHGQKEIRDGIVAKEFGFSALCFLYVHD